MRMQLDATQVDDPGESRRIVNHDFFRSASRRECQCDRSQPRRALAGRALLIKRLTFGAVNEPLENERTIANPGKSTRRDGQVVANDVEFREPSLPGKIGFVRVRHADLVSLDREQLGCFFFSHQNQSTPIGALSTKRWPPSAIQVLDRSLRSLILVRNS